MDRLAGKTAFVTAAAQGIGRTTALAFAAESAKVIATDIDGARLGEIVGERVRALALDVTDAEAVAAAVLNAGPIDVLFNCAGFVHQGTILDAIEAEWDFAFTLNVRSMFRTIRAALAAMLERRSGSIINVASAASSIKGAPNRFIYGTTKAAVIGLTKSVAADTVARGVRCNAICPGTVRRRAWTTASPPTRSRPGGWTPLAPRSWPAKPWPGSARRRRSPRWPSISPPTRAAS